MMKLNKFQFLFIIAALIVIITVSIILIWAIDLDSKYPSCEDFDSDDDGFLDEIDDFPNNASYHKKMILASSSQYLYGEDNFKKCPVPECSYTVGFISPRKYFDLHPCKGVKTNDLFEIDNRSKAVFCDWFVKRANNGSATNEAVSLNKNNGGEKGERIFLIVQTNLSGEIVEYDYVNGLDPINNYTLVTDENIGSWKFRFRYQEIPFDAIIYYEIYTAR